MRTLLIALAAACTFAGGCGPARYYYRPTEHVTGSTPRTNLPVAVYELYTPERAKLGEVKLSSQGVYAVKEPEGQRKALHLQLELENNTTDRSYTFDPRAALVTLLDDGSPPLAPTRVIARNVTVAAEPVVIGPAGQARFELLYLLPPSVRTKRLDTFSVRWEIATAGDRRVERTRFARMEKGDLDYPDRRYAGYADGWFYPGYGYFPYWDPYFYPSQPFAAPVLLYRYGRPRGVTVITPPPRYAVRRPPPPPPNPPPPRAPAPPRRPTAQPGRAPNR